MPAGEQSYNAEESQLTLGVFYLQHQVCQDQVHGLAVPDLGVVEGVGNEDLIASRLDSEHCISVVANCRQTKKRFALGQSTRNNGCTAASIWQAAVPTRLRLWRASSVFTAVCSPANLPSKWISRTHNNRSNPKTETVPRTCG